MNIETEHEKDIENMKKLKRKQRKPWSVIILYNLWIYSLKQCLQISMLYLSRLWVR